MNSVFANRSKEEEIFPLTVKKIAKAQGLDKLFKASAIKEKHSSTVQLVGITTTYNTLEIHA